VRDFSAFALWIYSINTRLFLKLPHRLLVEGMIAVHIKWVLCNQMKEGSCDTKQNAQVLTSRWRCSTRAKMANSSCVAPPPSPKPPPRLMYVRFEQTNLFTELLDMSIRLAPRRWRHVCVALCVASMGLRTGADRKAVDNPLELDKGRRTVKTWECPGGAPVEDRCYNV